MFLERVWFRLRRLRGSAPTQGSCLSYVLTLSLCVSSWLAFPRPVPIPHAFRASLLQKLVFSEQRILSVTLSVSGLRGAFSCYSDGNRERAVGHTIRVGLNKEILNDH